VLQFTNRVKADIALQGGLVDLDWSVVLFYMPPVFSDFVSVSLSLMICWYVLVSSLSKAVSSLHHGSKFAVYKCKL